VGSSRLYAFNNKLFDLRITNVFGRAIGARGGIAVGEKRRDLTPEEFVELHCIYQQSLLMEKVFAAGIYKIKTRGLPASNWWLVSEWLANQLKSRGEIVLERDLQRWWGRVTFGEPVHLDPTIEELTRIYNECP
jgi:hypothetical protein